MTLNIGIFGGYLMVNLGLSFRQQLCRTWKPLSIHQNK